MILFNFVLHAPSGLTGYPMGTLHYYAENVNFVIILEYFSFVRKDKDLRDKVAGDIN